MTTAGFLAYGHSRPTQERAGMELERVKKVNQIESIQIKYFIEIFIQKSAKRSV